MFEIGIGAFILYTTVVAIVSGIVAQTYQKGDIKRLCHEAKTGIKDFFTDDFFGIR